MVTPEQLREKSLANRVRLQQEEINKVNNLMFQASELGREHVSVVIVWANTVEHFKSLGFTTNLIGDKVYIRW